MPKYVKVRIAVAVDHEGNWVSAGWSQARDSDLIDSTVEGVLPDEARYWVISELEIPEERKLIEVKASKVEVDNDE